MNLVFPGCCLLQVGPREAMTEPLWDFGDIGTERRESLLVPFDFDTLIDSICSEARNIQWERDKGTHEAKGSWRPIFRFDVREQTFDRFFNSPYGYRGQYLADPEEGRRKNCTLVFALIDKLVDSIRAEPELLNQVRNSLGSALLTTINCPPCVIAGRAAVYAFPNSGWKAASSPNTTEGL